jgi:hypothetical protein
MAVIGRSHLVVYHSLITGTKMFDACKPMLHYEVCFEQ